MKSFTFSKTFRWLQKKESQAFILAFFCTFFVFPVFIESSISPIPNSGPSWSSLDPSWKITLSKINIDHLIWGKDFVLTYGPLSYLSTRVGWGANSLCFILFDLFISFNFFYIFYNAYIKGANKKISALLILAASFLIPVSLGSGTALVLFIFLVFWIGQSLDENKLLFYLMQIVIICLAFYIKFNTGLMAFVIFFISQLYKIIFTRQNKTGIVVYSLILVIVGLLLASVLNVSLLHYVKGGMELVKGYNEIMYLNEPYIKELWVSVIIMVTAVAILVTKTYLEREELARNLMILFLFSSSAFILYKQAFTRCDMPHVREFYKFILLLIVCMPDTYVDQLNKGTKPILIFIIFMALFIAKNLDPHVMFKLRILKADYVKGLMSLMKPSELKLFPNNNQIPERIKNKVGENTIDAYPWNTQLLFENKLNYVPRPVFQSYTAYTPYLENLNVEFYRSVKAPKYVMYEFDAIDGRYPLFDESKLNLMLLKNYTCIDTFSFAGRPVVILEKNKIRTQINLVKIKEYEIDTNNIIIPGKDKYYELFMSNTFYGKCVAVLNHSPELQLEIITKDGNQRRYRTSKKLLETGIFLTRHFNGTLDFYNYINNDSLNNESEITGYKIKRLNPSCFTDKIKVVEYKIN